MKTLQILALLITPLFLTACTERKYYELIKNDVEFTGTVTNFIISNNHSFGIVELKISESNVSNYEKKLPGSYLFPYKIKDSIAELYVEIPPSKIELGLKAKVNSNREIVEYYKGDSLSFLGGVYVRYSSTDKDYANKNSIFNK